MRKHSLFLIFLILALLLGGCSTNVSQPEWPTLTVSLPISGDSTQLERVNEALNAHLETQLGVHIHIVPYTSAEEMRKTVSEGMTLDISYCSSLAKVQELQHSGLILAMDDLLEKEGQAIPTAIALEQFDYTRIGGSLYTLPTNKDWVRINGFEYNREIAQRYGLDFSDVHSIEDLTPVFEKLRAQTEEISPIAVVPGFIYFDQVNTLSDTYGVLCADSGRQVVDLYSSDQFSDFIHLLRRWRQDGYTFPDPGENESILYYISSGKVLGCLTVGKPGFEVQERRLSGCDVGFVALGEPYYSMDRNQRAWYVIPSTAADPVLSMRLMNLLYSDPTVANLLIYGIEGEHYTLTQSGQVSRIAGSGFGGVNDWAYCNCFIAHIPEGLDSDFWQELHQANEKALHSSTWGFLYDSTPVAEQLYRCDLVTEQYLNLLYSGVSDPDVLLPQFRQELKAAGIDDIIAEKQRQLDAFMEGH